MNYNYSEFKQQILSDLQERLGSDVRVTVQDIIKNNDTHLDGLTILSTKYNLSPTIYLNSYFKQYENGHSLSDIENDILKVYHDNRPSDNIDISFFTDYDKVKSRIIFKLVNYERNRELLKEVPHYRFLDLSIVFNCLVESSPSGSATILIHNQHLNYWGITKDDLYALAQQNTPRLLSYDLRNMTDILKELLSDEDIPADAPDATTSYPMYVLTNRYKLNGSGCILYQNLLRDFANRLESDLFILPSSVHEVLIIPVKNKTSPQELSDMVKDVNSSQLSREEILSDHVYYFSRESGQITM
ncbi:MAG: DUF5688 family protein [Clostridiales bacterium]|nr:DUF5688 family protein [Roseburia sp.]MDD7635880.1 DUF5688 family protein [Clostridiales bacterium]MDY4111416.1 DUF5688 family protein [Roseburia sp.]